MNLLFGFTAQETLKRVDQSIANQNADTLSVNLSSPYLQLNQVKKDNSSVYLSTLTQAREHKQVCVCRIVKSERHRYRNHYHIVSSFMI